MNVKFNVGRTLMTAGVNSYMEEHIVSMNELITLLDRHVSGDWGDIPEEDAELNEGAIRNKEGRIMSAYELSGKRVWIITDGLHDEKETYTTVLFPEEY
jgi:hypothetical protein